MYCSLPKSFPFADVNSTNGAIEFLYDVVKSPRLYQPFFLAVGFHRPHVENSVSEELLETIPLNEVIYPSLHEPSIQGIVNNGGFRQSLSYFICKESASSKLVEFGTGIWKLTENETEGRYLLSDLTDNKGKYYDTVLRIRRGYLVAIKLIDTQFGRLLDALEATGLDNSIIVILTSDHGFSHGEKGMWCKNSLVEKVTKVLLTISLPKGYLVGSNVPIDECANGCTSIVGLNRSPIQLVDLFPTLIDHLGTTKDVDTSNVPIDGFSFIDTLRSPNLILKSVSYIIFGYYSQTIKIFKCHTYDTAFIFHNVFVITLEI